MKKYNKYIKYEENDIVYVLNINHLSGETGSYFKSVIEPKRIAKNGKWQNTYILKDIQIEILEPGEYSNTCLFPTFKDALKYVNKQIQNIIKEVKYE